MHAFCSPLPIFGTRIGPRQKSFWPASSGNFPVTVFTRSNWHACKVDKINIPQRRRHKICSDEEDQENLKLEDQKFQGGSRDGWRRDDPGAEVTLLSKLLMICDLLQSRNVRLMMRCRILWIPF